MNNILTYLNFTLMTWGRKKERRQLTSNYLVFSDMAEGLQREPTWEEARLSQHTEVLQVVASGGPGNPALLAVLLRALKPVQAVSLPSPRQQGCQGIHTSFRCSGNLRPKKQPLWNLP